MTNRLNALLLLALLVSALYLVHLSHEGRRLFTALDRAQAEARQLEFDHQRLLAERQAQATPLRVEKTAREKLAMRSATPAVTQYVDAPDAGAGSLRTAAVAVEPAPAAVPKGRP